MSFFDRLPKILGLSKGGGGSKLPPVEDPKVKPKQVSLPGYLTTTRIDPNSALTKTDVQAANLDPVTSYRNLRTTPEIIRALCRVNPDASAALAAFLRVGIPEKYIVLARDPDGSINDDGTRLAYEIMQRMDKMPGYASGFSQVDSLRSVSESLAKEAVIEGALAMELVLDKGRLPYKFQPVAVKGIKFYPDVSGGTQGLKPVQDVGGEELDLDIATFFMSWVDPSLTDAYPQSPFEAAVQPVLASAQFMMDLRRVMQRHVYPRYNITINEEVLRKNTPQEVLLDPDQLATFINTRVSEVESAIQNLEPQDAILHFDFVTVEYIKNSDMQGAAEQFTALEEILNANLAKGAKVMPAVLGNGAGSQNVASTETMLFLMQANAMIRLKLQELYSRAFTLAVRLFGLDVTVSFEFDDIELRPATELEAFKTMRFERWCKLWGLGVMSDMEFCMRVNYMPTPAGFASQAGTLTLQDILGVAAQTDPAGNSYSGTGAGGGQSGGGAATQSRKPATPQKSRGNPAK
jgi:hypothetical protein